MDDIRIRPCAPGDYDAVNDIYNHYIENSHATFDTRPYSIGERAPWFSQFYEAGPNQLLVAEKNGAVLGFCCSMPLKNRAAYDVSVETTVYLAADAIGQGIGRQLYEALLNNLSGIGPSICMKPLDFAKLAFSRKSAGNLTNTGASRGTNYVFGIDQGPSRSVRSAAMLIYQMGS
jgi:GNAT superfamily N-acetyltransferase